MLFSGEMQFHFSGKRFDRKKNNVPNVVQIQLKKSYFQFLTVYFIGEYFIFDAKRELYLDKKK